MRWLGLMALFVIAVSCDDEPEGAAPGDVDASDSRPAVSGDAEAVDSPSSNDVSSDSGRATAGDAVDLASPATACAVPCLASLDRECPAVGACIEEPTPSGGVGRRYSNGVSACAGLFQSANAMISWGLLSYYKADGSPCFQVQDVTKTTPSFLWFGPTGVRVATGTLDPAGRVVASCDDNVTYTLAQGCPGVAALPRKSLSDLLPSPVACAPGVDAGCGTPAP
jgi:hypothetical protein